MEQLTGFRRPDRRSRVRNHVLVLPLHSAANLAAERSADGLPGAVSVGHQWEAAEDDPDRERIANTLAGFAANPNCYATVLIGIRKEDTAIAEAAVRRGGR